MECKARLRGLYRIISSKTISPRPGEAKTACAGQSGLFLQRPSALGYPGRSPPSRAMADIYSKTIFQHPGKEQRPATTYARLTGIGFAEGACIPSLVLGFRTPQTPPSLLVGEGGWGKRGKSAREYRKLLISPKNSTLKRHARSVRWASLPTRHCTPCNWGRPLSHIAPPLRRHGSYIRRMPWRAAAQ